MLKWTTFIHYHIKAACTPAVCFIHSKKLGLARVRFKYCVLDPSQPDFNLHPSPMSGSHTSELHVAVTLNVLPSSLDSSYSFSAVLFLWLAYLLSLQPFLGPAQIIPPLFSLLRSSGLFQTLALSCLLLHCCSYLVCLYPILKCLRAGDIICWMNKWLARAKG